MALPPVTIPGPGESRYVVPATGHQVKVLAPPDAITVGAAWNTQLPACSSRKNRLLLVTGNMTTSALPCGAGVCVTDCQLAGDERLVVDVNCQAVKLLGQDSFAVAVGRREIESTGDWASAMDAMMNTQNET